MDEDIAALIIAVMTVVNIVGSKVVARAQTVIVVVVIGSLAVFAVATLLNINPELLAPSGYPPAAGHHLECGAHVLRLSRIRHRDLHSQGPKRPLAGTSEGHVPGTGNCGGRVRGGLSGVFGP